MSSELLPSLLVLVTLSVATAPTLAAESTPRSPPAPRIDIDAQALRSALDAWRVATGERLTIDSALVDGKTSAPVHGTLGASDSLRLLIASAGLVPTQAPTGDWTLAQATPSTPAQTSAQALEPVSITGVRQKAMVARQGVEIRDLPEAITVIPKVVLEEAAARRYEDIAYSTVGITPYVPFANAGSSGGYSRGFNANLLVDGFSQGFAGLTSGLGIVDHVEVLRGPTSVLYGQGDPGGSVNLVLKRPLSQFGFAGSATADSVGTRLVDLDVTGPISPGFADFRLVAQGENSYTFRDFDKNKRAQIAPMLAVVPWQGARLNLLGSFDRYEYTAVRDYYASVFPVGLLESVPVGRNLGEPTLPLSRLDTTMLRAELVQQLGESWSATASVYDYKSINKSYFAINATDEDPDNPGVFNRRYVKNLDPNHNVNRSRDITVRLNGNFAALGVQHKLLIGIERLTNDFDYDAVVGDYSPINIFNPVYQPSVVEPALQPLYLGGQSIKTVAGYANDLISIGKDVKVQLGVRYDHIESTGFGDVAQSTLTDKKLSPSIGVVWQPTGATSLYASYSTAFVPQIGTDRNGTQLKPERSKAYEVGVKQEVFDRRMAVTLAAFEIVKNDILQTDPTDNDFVINGGKAKSQGFELEVEGRTPVPGLSVRGGLAYAFSRLYDSTDFPTNTRLAGPRPWTALASAKQRLGMLGMDDTWVSASTYYGGKAVVQAPSDGQKLPSFTRIDLAAGKTFGHFELQLNVKNLLNDRIFISNGGGLLLFDNPRSIGATLNYRTGAL